MQRKWKRRWQQAARIIAPPVVAGTILLSTHSPAWANPTGGTVTSGAATIAASGSTMTVTQKTDKTVINWQSFSIGAGEKVRFLQPGASSIALNRVMGNNASNIYGTLTANGRVYLINPNGVLFAPGAQVNVGGLVASTLNITDSDFLAGKYSFNGSGGSVTNQGSIIAADGGYVALLGGQVSNQGVIAAKQGTVALGAGKAMTLDFNGDGLLSLAVNQSAVNALAENKNLIQADGGTVLMTAGAADALAGTVVNNSGIVQARAVNRAGGVIRLEGGNVQVSGTLDTSGKNAGEKGGTIKVLGNTIDVDNASFDVSGNSGGTVLVGGNSQGQGPERNAADTNIGGSVSINADATNKGDGGKVVVWADGTTKFAGTISARGGANGGNGGSVETSGKESLILAGTVNAGAPKGKAGTWLLDPTDYTIDAVAAASIGASLNSGTDVTVSSSQGTSGVNGDLTVGSGLNWTTGNTLTLSAYRDVNINANITNSNSVGANVTLRADNTGISSGTVTFGSGNKVTTNGAVTIYYNPGGSFNATVNGAMVSIPKDYTHPTDYSRNAVIYTGGTAGNVTAYMLVNNVNELQAIGTNRTTLAGNYALGRDIDASVTRTWNPDHSYHSVPGTYYYGFLSLGVNDATSITTPYTGIFNGGGHTINGMYMQRDYSFHVALFGEVGTVGVIKNLGMVGNDFKCSSYTSAGIASINNGIITDSYNTGKAGAGIASINNGIIANSYNTGTVTAGIAGMNNGLIVNSYNTGAASSNSYAYNGAGIAGTNGDKGIIVNCYNAGTVSGSSFVGGIAGDNEGGTISNSYNTGAVTSTEKVSLNPSFAGGVAGHNGGTIDNTYNTGAVTGKGSYVGGLVGYNDGTGRINHSFSTGLLTGYNSIGGLVGYNCGNVRSSYWNTETSGKTASSGGVGLTTAQMKDKSTYSDWNFTRDWGMSPLINGGYPYLQGVTATNKYTFSGQLNATGAGKTVTLLNEGTLLGTTTTDASGNYSFDILTDGPGVSGDFLAYITGNSVKASGVFLANGNSAADFDLTAGKLTVDGNGQAVSNTDLARAIGNQTSADILYTASGNDITLKADTVIKNASSINFNGAMNAGTRSLSLSTVGAATQSAAITAAKLELAGAGGTYALTNSANSIGTLAANTGTVNVVSTAAVNIGTVGATTGITTTSDATVIAAKNFTIDSGAKVGSSSGDVNLVTRGKFINREGADAVSAGGNWTIYSTTPTGDTVGGLNYDYKQYNTSYGGFLQGSGNGLVYTYAPKVTVGLTGTVKKVYDGTTDATLASANYKLISGKAVSGDVLTYSGTASYNNKNAGSGKKVNVSSISLTASSSTGKPVYGYQLANATASGAKGVITAKALSAGGITADDKVYDASTKAVIHTGSADLNGVVAGDSVNLVGTKASGAFSDKNAGTDKTVTIKGLKLSGTDAANYTVTTTATTTADIAQKQLTAVTGITAANKVYDGTTGATLNTKSAKLSGVIRGDKVTVSGAVGTFSDANVGTGKTVTIDDFTLGGTAGGNYTLSGYTTATKANISPKVISAIGIAASNKTYDATTVAVLDKIGDSLSGIIGSDDVSLIDAGTNKTSPTSA